MADNLKNNKKYLVGLGFKEALLDKLDSDSIRQLVSYAMDHIGAAHLLQNLISLASMWLGGKKGAIFLADHGIATVQQLKGISAEEIAKIVDLYLFNNDPDIAVKSVVQALIFEQQEKLYNQTNGLKGEYYVLRDEIEARNERFTHM